MNKAASRSRAGATGSAPKLAKAVKKSLGLDGAAAMVADSAPPAEVPVHAVHVDIPEGGVTALKQPAGAKAGKKPKQARLVKESVKLLADELETLRAIKRSCADAGIKVKKGELLRAGIVLLQRAGAAEAGSLASALAKTSPAKKKKPAEAKAKDKAKDKTKMKAKDKRKDA